MSAPPDEETFFHGLETFCTTAVEAEEMRPSVKSQTHSLFVMCFSLFDCFNLTVHICCPTVSNGAVRGAGKFKWIRGCGHP